MVTHKLSLVPESLCGCQRTIKYLLTFHSTSLIMWDIYWIKCPDLTHLPFINSSTCPCGLLCGEVLFISNLILLVPSLDINTLSPLLLVITLASLPSQSFIFFAKSSTLLGTVLRVPSLQGL